MWTALFVIAVAAAICFGIAAIILQLRDKGRDVTETRRSADVPTTGVPSLDLPASGLQSPILLIDRMKSLRLDPNVFARFDPILFQELSIRCGTCDSVTRCASDLARNANDEMNQNWRDYCPNAATFNMLSIVRDYYSALRNSEGAARLS